MDWLNLPTGVVVVGVVLMALFMFWGAEQLERRFGGRKSRSARGDAWPASARWWPARCWC
jgi:hypothetical protein